MFHTFEYKPGYFIHTSDEPGSEPVKWQGPNGHVIAANTVQGAKMAITREIKMREAGAEIC